jgi:hypothetical protein
MQKFSLCSSNVSPRFYAKEKPYLLLDGEQYNHYSIHSTLVHYLYTPYMLI